MQLVESARNVPAHARYSDGQAEALAAQVLDLFRHGLTVQDAAASLGVPMRTAYNWLIQFHETDYKQVQVGEALADYETAKGELERAQENWQVARAAQMCRNAQWQLERVYRRVYGEDRSQVAAVAVSIVMDFSQSAPTDVSERPLE